MKATQLTGLIGLLCFAGAANAATLIGPGSGITDATDQDTPGEDRLNVDRTTFVTLVAGTYSVDDWRLNVHTHSEGGTITPMLLSGTPANYTTVWVGSAFDPDSDGVQTVAASGTFTLAVSTDIYAGFFTSGLGSGIIGLDGNNSGSGTSITDHDNNGFNAPTGAGQTVESLNGFSHAGNLTRTYAFEINVSEVPEPSSVALLGLGGLALALRRRR